MPRRSRGRARTALQPLPYMILILIYTSRAGAHPVPDPRSAQPTCCRSTRRPARTPSSPRSAQPMHLRRGPAHPHPAPRVETFGAVGAVTTDEIDIFERDRRWHRRSRSKMSISIVQEQAERARSQQSAEANGWERGADRRERRGQREGAQRPTVRERRHKRRRRRPGDRPGAQLSDRAVQCFREPGARWE